MTSGQIRCVLKVAAGYHGSDPTVPTDGISVIEWRLPGGFRYDVAVQDNQGQARKLVAIPEALRALDSDYGPARPYGLAVDGMAIYKGVHI